ncbi:hypothetical protein G5I_10646, partial [Acromyrmex echinatior]
IVSGLCAACMLAKVEQERLESLKYDRATIYVKCIDENVESKMDDADYEVTTKKPKIAKARPSRTRRKLKGSHELKVSSEITLKELKVMKNAKTMKKNRQGQLFTERDSLAKEIRKSSSDILIRLRSSPAEADSG